MCREGQEFNIVLIVIVSCVFDKCLFPLQDFEISNAQFMVTKDFPFVIFYFHISLHSNNIFNSKVTSKNSFLQAFGKYFLVIA